VVQRRSGAGPGSTDKGVAACAFNQTGQAHISRSLAMHLQEFVVGGTGIAEVLLSRVVRYLAFPS
jgi:hypothetical protein